MHATYPENARLKAVASPCTTIHSNAPGDCPPVYMPPSMPVMDRFEAQRMASNAQITGINSGNKALEYAARELYYRINDRINGSYELSPEDEDTLYACIAFAAALTPPLQALSVPVHHEFQTNEPHPGGSPCVTTVANISSRGQSAAHAATIPARKSPNPKNMRLWSLTLKPNRPIGARSRALGVS